MIGIIVTSAWAADALPSRGPNLRAWSGVPLAPLAAGVDVWLTREVAVGARGLYQSSSAERRTCLVNLFSCDTITTDRQTTSVLGTVTVGTPHLAALRMSMGLGYGSARTERTVVSESGAVTQSFGFAGTTSARPGHGASGAAVATAFEPSIRVALSPTTGLSTLVALDSVWTSDPQHRFHLGLGFDVTVWRPRSAREEEAARAPADTRDSPGEPPAPEFTPPPPSAPDK